MNNKLALFFTVFISLQLLACAPNDVYTFPTNSESWGMNSPSTVTGLPQSPIETQFSIASYNLKAIPPIFESDFYTQSNAQRANVFANYLKTRTQQNNAPDVVLLQEIFDPNFLWTIVRNANYPYYYTDYPANYSLENLFSGGIKAVPSGLLILSKHPITEAAFHPFPYTMCALDDCFAKKGVLWVKIQQTGVPAPIHIFNTHMQANTAQEAVREKQIENMEDFVNSKVNNAGVVFFGGDFNFRMNESYRTDDLFINLFEQQDSFLSCLNATDCQSVFQAQRVTNELGLVDHIFYKSNSDVVTTKVIQARASEEKFNLNGQINHLSDHPMIEVMYRLHWK